ncbi:hypothetical protein YC2023_059900 [Brassica napus]
MDRNNDMTVADVTDAKALSSILMVAVKNSDFVTASGGNCSVTGLLLSFKAQRFHFQTEFLLSQLRSSTPCVSDCKIMEINVTCGWFSSVRLVNPRVFRRLSYYDCLVKDGQPLAPGQTLSFLPTRAVGLGRIYVISFISHHKVLTRIQPTRIGRHRTTHFGLLSNLGSKKLHYISYSGHMDMRKTKLNLTKHEPNRTQTKPK